MREMQARGMEKEEAPFIYCSTFVWTKLTGLGSKRVFPYLAVVKITGYFTLKIKGTKMENCLRIQRHNRVNAYIFTLFCGLL